MLFCSGLQEAYHRIHDVMDPTSANTNPRAELQSQITFPILPLHLNISCISLMLANNLCCGLACTFVSRCLSSQ